MGLLKDVSARVNTNMNRVATVVYFNHKQITVKARERKEILKPIIMRGLLPRSQTVIKHRTDPKNATNSRIFVADLGVNIDSFISYMSVNASFA